jgi:activator of HSP90 ATPase
MTKPIIQSVDVPATAKQLFDLYMNPKLHAAFTGAPVKISPKPNSPFTAFGGMLSGTTLLTVPNKLIVQRWRGSHWKKTDLDSILILKFSQIGKLARIDLTHVHVPDHDHADVTSGWKTYYWQPLRAYLKTKF